MVKKGKQRKIIASDNTRLGQHGKQVINTQMHLACATVIHCTHQDK